MVVDDALMGMTHVLRGDDHPEQHPAPDPLLYQALGYPVPASATCP